MHIAELLQTHAEPFHFATSFVSWATSSTACSGASISQVAIVDEGQNLLPEEVYTMITRIEEGGKLIILGDATQNDIRGENALQWLPKFMEKNPELAEHIAIIEATSDDIERGGLCKAMVKAKERSGM